MSLTNERIAVLVQTNAEYHKLLSECKQLEPEYRSAFLETQGGKG